MTKAEVKMDIDRIQSIKEYYPLIRFILFFIFYFSMTINNVDTFDDVDTFDSIETIDS